MINAIHFLRPWWLVALPLFWALAVWLARRQKSSYDWSNYIDKDLAPSLRLGSDKRGSISVWPLIAAVWTCAIIALAGPSWQQDKVAAYRAPASWMMLLDLSPSMQNKDIAPDRATRARYAMTDLLAGAHDAKVGLIAFSDEPYTVTPFTQDVETIKSLLPSLTPDIMPSPGNQLTPALKRANDLISQAGSNDKQVILFSDGFDDPSSALSTAAELKAKGIHVNVVGIGGNQSELQQLATTGGGMYVDLNHLPDLVTHLQARDMNVENSVDAATGIEVSHWRDGGIWLLPLLLIGAALVARKDWI